MSGAGACPGSGVAPDADVQWHALPALHLGGVVLDGLLHTQRRVTSAHGVVFVRHRRAEERHDAIAEHLVDGAFVAVHGIHHDVQRRVQELAGLFRIEARDQFGRALEIGKEHGDLLALAFQGAARGEDLLGQILRSVR